MVKLIGGVSSAVMGMAIVALPYPARAGVVAADNRPIVRTLNDLPRHTYAVSTSAVDLLNANDAEFSAFAARVEKDVDDTLANYDIQDHSTLRELLTERMTVQLISHRDSDALKTISQIRALEDKPDARLMSGVRSEAIARARLDTGAARGKGYEDKYAALYSAALKPLPWGVVGTRMKEAKGNAQILSPALLEGVVKQSIEPAVSRDHQIDDKLAASMLAFRMLRDVEIPLHAQSVAVLSEIVKSNTVVKPDIWAARDVALTATDKLTPVVVGVWDSGTDLSLFPTQTYTDPHPPAALPYNAHGLAFDVDSRPSTGPLLPLTSAQTAQYTTMIADFQGFRDLEQSIDSSAADALRAKLASMKSAEVPAYLEELKLYSNYLHGTHVAGIFAKGNPAARLAVARITYDYRNVPDPPTDENMMREIGSYQTTVDWFRMHKVRVVNMSWASSPAALEHALEVNGIGKDASDRKRLARHYFDIERAGLFNALRSAPEILFVCAAGNGDSDNGFGEEIPSSFVLPNVLTVGAVDRAGDEASFTSYGKNVRVHANGYQVDSVVPGGKHLLDSGTSMASPNVANLAAKLLALHPNLTPTRIIGLIEAGSTPSDDGRRHNIDPSKSIALAKGS